MKFSYIWKIAEVSVAGKMCVVEYTIEGRTARVNVGLPSDKADLECRVAQRVPRSIFPAEASAAAEPTMTEEEGAAFVGISGESTYENQPAVPDRVTAEVIFRQKVATALTQLGIEVPVPAQVAP